MKADQIIKNAKIFTADRDKPMATALAVKDGKFDYVGDEAGLSAYEGEVTDLGGRFIMPGVLDTHVHITTSLAFEYADLGVRIGCNGKQAALDFMADYVSKNPGLARYRFLLPKACLNGEILVKEDLDSICPDTELVVLEGECHSVWVNSRVLEAKGITDDTPDSVPGLSYYVRKDGHITGNAFESTAWPFLFDLDSLTDEQMEGPLLRFIDYCVNYGVAGVFDAGFPEYEEFHERVYSYLRKLDEQGKLPVYIDGCYILTNPSKTEQALKGLKRMNREFNTEHMKVHTLKILMDGTMKIHTAAMVTPYEDTHETGATTFDAEGIANILKQLNEAGLDLHIHTVGERASRVVLDGVALAKKELGDSFRMKVTCCHLEIQDDADLPRFAELGVFANYTPGWHAGAGNDITTLSTLFGEKRASNMYRSKTVWDTGAIVTWSSDNVSFGDFTTWSPYLGMEVGMTRKVGEKARVPEYNRSNGELPPASEKMSVEEMLLGYTINGAKQLGIADKKGSIEVGKDADFLVFDNDLLTAPHEGFSYNLPRDVYFCGKKMN